MFPLNMMTGSQAPAWELNFHAKLQLFELERPSIFICFHLRSSAVKNFFLAPLREAQRFPSFVPTIPSLLALLNLP
jgi:hypothetical protein